MTEDRRGLLYGVAAYGLWGVVPVFWKQIATIDPIEVLAHRALWGVVVLVAIVWLAKRQAAVREAARDRRVLGAMALSSALLAVNWGVFVLAVATDRLLDASLGYFINPLVSVALGTLVLRERLRRLQWVAIGLAAAGVAVLTWRAGRVPWVALVLASTWGVYGLVRKTAKVEALVGSTIETILLVPIAIVYLAVLGGGQLAAGDPQTIALLVGTGVVTAVPLIFFTSAARLLPLSTVGFLQYLAPTGQFLLAVVAFGEPLAHEKLLAFGLIWVGLAAFSVDLWHAASSARTTRT